MKKLDLYYNNTFLEKLVTKKAPYYHGAILLKNTTNQTITKLRNFSEEYYQTQDHHKNAPPDKKHAFNHFQAKDKNPTL
jgi:hypothetical protein